MSWFKFGKEANKAELTKKRSLPMGVTEFHAWAENIAAGAYIPGATLESIKFALANEILHLDPKEDQAEDLYFIKKLRKYAANQVADAIRCEIRDQAKARLAAEEEDKKPKLAEVTALSEGVTDGKEILGKS